MNDNVIVFLDVLGFSQYVKQNNQDAMEILNSIQRVIEANKANERKARQYHDETVKKLVTRHSLSSFQSLVSISDSIFVTGENANKLLDQVATFLCCCFQWQFSEHKNSGIPCIFRGGIAVGEIFQYPSKDLIRCNRGLETFEKNNFCGNAVVTAVRLEEQGKGQGPNLFLDDTFIRELDDKHKKLIAKIIINGKSTCYFLWPAYFVFEDNNFDNKLKNIELFLNMVLYYYKKYKDSKVNNIYLEFLKLSLQAFHIVLLNDKNYTEEKWKEKLQDIFQKHNVNIEFLLRFIIDDM